MDKIKSGGNIIADGDICAETSSIISGGQIISRNGRIECGKNIFAEESIRAREVIHAKQDITAIDGAVQSFRQNISARNIYAKNVISGLNIRGRTVIAEDIGVCAISTITANEVIAPSVKAGWEIFALECIQAEKYITVTNGSIHSMGSVTGKCIAAKHDIKARSIFSEDYIKAGGNIEVSDDISCTSKNIVAGGCVKIRGYEVPGFVQEPSASNFHDACTLPPITKMSTPLHPRL